jgi:hypothetical protein
MTSLKIVLMQINMKLLELYETLKPVMTDATDDVKD